MSPPHDPPAPPTDAYEEFWAALDAAAIDSGTPRYAPPDRPDAYAEFLALDEV